MRIRLIFTAFFLLGIFFSSSEVWSQAAIGTKEENRAIDAREYALNKAHITQIGDFNDAHLEQAGYQINAHITQNGFNHRADVSITGSDNTFSLDQSTRNNVSLVGLSGSNNLLKVNQIGSGNFVDLQYTETDNLNKFIEQNGSGNHLSIHLDYYNGASVPFSIVQKHGAKISIRSVEMFENLIANPNN